MKRIGLIMIGFVLGFIFTAIISMYTIKIDSIVSEGTAVDNAGVTITLFGNKFNYYYE